jgi:hypothetical protein
MYVLTYVDVIDEGPVVRMLGTSLTRYTRSSDRDGIQRPTFKNTDDYRCNVRQETDPDHHSHKL